MSKLKIAGIVLAILVGLPLLLAYLFGLNAASMVGGTIVEREVFEQSRQYQEARFTSEQTYLSELAAIEAQLNDDSLSPAARRGLEAQRARLQTLINVERQRRNQ
tara:strand:+ start:1406 stop:1720 length:315 start_codon:yes stop_codon:yes gene_type:complete